MDNFALKIYDELKRKPNHNNLRERLAIVAIYGSEWEVC